MAKSKSGIHYLGRGADPALLSLMQCSKWVNNPPPPNLPAGFVAVWRWVENPDSINGHFNDSPEGTADWWIAKQQPHFIDIPKSAYVEGPNENACETVAQAEWLARFEIRRMQEMEKLGYRCCIFNFGTGRPPTPTENPDIWTALLPALRFAKANGDIIGMHAYQYDPHDTFNMLRYRQVYAWLPADARPNLFIGEWGLDGAKGRFRDSAWRSQFADPDAEYVRIIAAYDDEVRKDPYVLGFALFADGTGGSSAWDPFNIDGTSVSQKLAAYLKSQTGDATPPASPPVVVPPPVVTPPAVGNLLANPDLFSGGFAPMPGHFSTNVPAGWTFEAKEGIGPDFQDSPHTTAWGVPTAVYHAAGNGRPGASALPASEHALYFNAANPVVYHLYLPWGKQWWKLSQTLPNLPAGDYQFKGELYPDIYTGAHRFAGDPACGQWRLNFSTIASASYKSGGFGKWNDLGIFYHHAGGDLTLTLECVAPFGIEVVGWFVRGLGLFKVDVPAPTPITYKDSDLVVVATPDLNVRAAPWGATEPAKVGLVHGGEKGIVTASPLTVANGATWARCVFLTNGTLLLGWVNADYLQHA